MELCLEAQLVYLEYECNRLQEDLDRLNRIFDARNLKDSKYIGLEAYDLSCLTGCKKVFPIDPYGKLANGTTWLIGLEEATDGEKKGIFSRFFGMIWNGIKSVTNFIFGGGGDTAGKATENTIKGLESLTKKAVAIQDLIRTHRTVVAKYTFPKGVPTVNFLDDFKGTNVVSKCTAFIESLAPDKILGFITEGVDHIAKAASDAAHEDFKYTPIKQELFENVRAAIKTAVDSQYCKDLGKFGLVTSSSSTHLVGAKGYKMNNVGFNFPLFNQAYSTSLASHLTKGSEGEITIMAGTGESTPYEKLFENPKEYIDLDGAVKWRDACKNHSKSAANLLHKLENAKSQAKEAYKAQVQKEISSDIKSLMDLTMGLTKCFASIVTLIQKHHNAFNRFMNICKEAITKAIEAADVKAKDDAAQKAQQDAGKKKMTIKQRKAQRSF